MLQPPTSSTKLLELIHKELQKSLTSFTPLAARRLWAWWLQVTGAISQCACPGAGHWSHRLYLALMLTWTDFTKKLCQIWVLAIKTACSLWWSTSFSKARSPDQDRFWLAWIRLASPVHRRRKVEQWDWSGTFAPQPRDATSTSQENSYMASTTCKRSKCSAVTCGIVGFGSETWSHWLPWAGKMQFMWLICGNRRCHAMKIYEVIWLAWALKPCACAQSWFLHELSEWRAWCGGWWDLSKGCITARTFHAFQGEISIGIISIYLWSTESPGNLEILCGIQFSQHGQKGFLTWRISWSLGESWMWRGCRLPGPSQTEVARKSADDSGWSEDVWRFDTAECDLWSGTSAAITFF